MPDFIHPSLLWAGLPIVALPILIHLINRVRQKRVQWAAMEFLLSSQKRNRNWILLKQLLLLLLRMGAIAAAVFMVAQPVLRSRLGSLFGGNRTHHILLLDDSFSMSDRFSGTTAFAEGVEVIRRLGEQATRQSSLQQFTLLRYSKAGQNVRGTQPDMHQRLVDADFVADLNSVLDSAQFQPSQYAVGPAETLDALSSLLSGQNDAQENRVVYLISDFRAREWENSPTLRDTLTRIAGEETQLQLIHCVDSARSNLAISGLKPGRATHAVGVNIPFEVSVTNYGVEPRRNVAVSLAQDAQARPAINFEEIRPGETATRTFEVKFLSPGEHRITAQLPDDNVAADNSRFAVIDVPRAVSVLVIDGSRQRFNDAFYLTRVLAPDPNTPTGIQPVEESVRYLGTKPLDEFQCIYLLNVGTLEQSAVDALEAYVRAGGGLAFFLGSETDVDFVNRQLYRDGQGVFPAPLVAQTELLANRLQPSGDVQITDHPIFARLKAVRNSDIDAVRISKYFAAKKNWEPSPDSTTKIIARLRTGVPLAVEQKFGAGTVVAFLTTAGATDWNNWARDNASYVMTMLELQAHLTSSRQQEPLHQVGLPIQLSLDAAKYAPAIRFATPATSEGEFAVQAMDDGQGSLRTTLAETQLSGFYEAQLTTNDQQAEQQSFAVNVLAQEGDLRTIDGQGLGELPSGIDYTYSRAEDVTFSARNLAGFHLSEGLLYGLVLLLIAEQIAAYSASYHPRRLAGAR